MALCTFRKSIFKTNITNWQQIPFTNRDINPFPQDISISPCGEYVVTMTHRPVLLLVYDLVENKFHSSIGSNDYKPTDFYWISPEMMYVRVCSYLLKDPEYGTAIFNISTSEIWILLVHGTLSARHSQVFVSNNAIIAIDPNKSIAIYDLNTCTKIERKINFGQFGDQIKTVFVEPSEVKQLPFVGTRQMFWEDDEIIYGRKCMKFQTLSDEVILISKTIAKKTNVDTDHSLTDVEMESDLSDEEPPAEYKQTLQMYLFNTSTHELHEIDSLFEDIESNTIVYDQGNAKWHWSNSTKFLLYFKKEATIEIIEGKINSGLDISYKTVRRLPYGIELSERDDTMNMRFYEMQYIAEQNALIKGKCTVKRYHGRYGWDNWRYFNHNLISLNHHELTKGDVVRIVGLKSKQHWNDKLATITGEYDVNRKRWPIQINFDDGTCALLKTENLVTDKSVTFLPSETEYATFIDQLSGLWFVQSKIKENEEEFTAGFKVMDHAKEIGFLKYPNFSREATVNDERRLLGEILLDIGASSIICCFLNRHAPVRQIYFADLGSRQQYFAILEKIHQNQNIGHGDFRQLTRSLVKCITEFLGN
eukprot:996809_1